MPVWFATAATILLAFAAAPSPAFDFFSLTPGMTRVEVLAALEKDRIKPIEERIDRVVVDSPVLGAIFERQTTIFRFEGARLVAVHLIVMPEWGSSGPDVMRLCEELRRVATRVLGRPSWERREGSAAHGELLHALSMGDLVRITQWEEKMRTIRLGLPRRVDGTVAPEILITHQRLPAGREAWGAER